MIFLRNKRLTFFVIFFSLVSNHVFSQKSFKTAYIITNNNETLFALVNSNSNLFQESPDLSNKTINTSFEYNSPVNITEDYHNSICTEYKRINYTKSTKRDTFLELNIGLIYSKMGMQTSSNVVTDIKPAIGITLRFKPDEDFDRWYFLLGISYSTNDFQGDFENGLINGKPKTYRMKIDYKIIRMPIMVDYSLLNKKIQPFLSAGFSPILIINPENETRLVSKSISGYENISQPYVSEFRNYQIGLLAGFGIRYYPSDRSNIYVKIDIEYSFPATNFHAVLDYHYVTAYIINFGYSYSL